MTLRLLILGATGMLGHTLMRELHAVESLDVHGSAHDVRPLRGSFPDRLLDRVTPNVDALHMDTVRRLLKDLQPDVVVNCIAVLKQKPAIRDTLTTITLNGLFPHQLAHECAANGIRLIHVSTDGVFAGNHGHYTEADNPDPIDLYGRAKLVGEVTGPPALTLRTSVIGHELESNRFLVDWFLSQSGQVNGYTRAIFSGVTAIELARLLRSVVLPRADLTGLHHVASTPISKYDLLRLIAREYGWTGHIHPYDGFVCDRSMLADSFFALTGYRPPAWPDMIADMHRSARSWRPRALARVAASG